MKNPEMEEYKIPLPGENRRWVQKIGNISFVPIFLCHKKLHPMTQKRSAGYALTGSASTICKTAPYVVK